MKLQLKNKKGSLQDIFFIVFVLFVMSMVIIVSYKFTDSLNTAFQANSEIDVHGKAASGAMNGLFGGVIDNSFLFLMVCLAILALSFAALVRVHPLFFVPYLILLTIMIFVSAAFSNVWQEVASKPEFTALADDLVFTSHIMNYLPLIIGVVGFLLAIVMYKLWSNAQ